MNQSFEIGQVIASHVFITGASTAGIMPCSVVTTITLFHFLLFFCPEPFRTQEYYLDTIGERDPLEEESITRSVITLVATGTRVKR